MNLLNIIAQYDQFILMLCVNSVFAYIIYRANRRTIVVKDPARLKIAHISS